MQKLLITTLLLVYMQTAYSQILPTLPPKSQTDSAAQKKAKPKTIKTAQADNNTETIKLISDEDCDVLIDAENKGHLHANTLLKINLRKGQYLLQVNGANAADQINETLTVDETGTERLYQIKLKVITDARVASDQANKQAEQQKQAEMQRQADLQKISLVLVQGGTFNMGSNTSESYGNEKPVHQVTVSSFYMSKYEITQAQWQAVMGNNPSANKCGNCPVEDITWGDAQAYCQKQSSLTGKTYRLPTEAEWEYAARGGNKSNGYTYSGSNNIDDVGWYGTNAGDTTHPAGQKQPNELGIYDMTGNVWEWCSDWYDANYYSNSPAQNPQGASEGSYRVVRGGGWGRTPRSCRAAFRSHLDPGYHLINLGFRPVVSF